MPLTALSSPTTDPAELAAAWRVGAIEAIGSIDPSTPGVLPVKRAMTLDDLEDDCAICQAHRKDIEAGNPPIVLVYE